MFRYFLLVLAAVAAVQGSVIPREETVFDRIVGGTDASIASYPYQLSLRLSNSHICGASLISASWAVSAAHCTINRVASSFTLVGGTNNVRSGGESRAVSVLINHPSYNSRTLDNDISLLRVATPFTLSSVIRAVALPAQGAAVADGSYAVVTGWGTLREGGSVSTILQQVSVPVVNQNTCNSLLGGGLTANMICAGYLSGGKDACQGDSGGPLVSNGRLIGVVSWGYGCARPNLPGVYARTANYRTWIQTNTGV